jgi:release factor glutamine methyltransferase
LCVGQLLREEKELSRIDLTAIVCHVLGVTTEQLLMNPGRELDSAQWHEITHLIKERHSNRPIAYITHSKEFFSHNFYVDERVLIPRPETEILLEEALGFLSGKGSNARILDMGTGSGIIGLSLAKAGADKVICIDISRQSIEVARINARLLDVEKKVSFQVSDLFSAVKTSEPFDLICANLPYVTTDEYNVLMADVREYEPKTALVGGNDGMDVYERFAEHIVSYIAPNGVVLCEIGSKEQAGKLRDLFSERGLKTDIKCDLEGRQRVVKGIWTSLS